MAGSIELARSVTPGAVLNLESVGYYDPAPGSQRMPPGLRMLAPLMANKIRARGSAGDFVMVVHRHDSTDVALGWAQAANEAGLPTIVHRDNRYTGAGTGLSAW